MPNQGKIQQEDGHAFSTNDTKLRYRTQNNGSPLEHAQVDSNFEIIRLTANGLVDDIKSNYDMIQLNKASIASLENRASELENKTSVNANDIAVNGVKIADNLARIEVLNLLTAAQGVDLENNEEAISVNATAILNLDVKTTDNHTALEARVSNNEISIDSLSSSTTTNANDIANLQDAVQLSAQAIDANTGSIDTINTKLSDHESRISSNDTDINSNKLATEANALAITNLQSADSALNSEISALKTADAGLDSRLTATSTLLQTTVEWLDDFSGTSDTTLAQIDSALGGIVNYSHPVGDGNLHVPATGIFNGGKVLTAGPTAGSFAWKYNSEGWEVKTYTNSMLLSYHQYGLDTSWPTFKKSLMTTYRSGRNAWIVGSYTLNTNYPAILDDYANFKIKMPNTWKPMGDILSTGWHRSYHSTSSSTLLSGTNAGHISNAQVQPIYGTSDYGIELWIVDYAGKYLQGGMFCVNFILDDASMNS